MKGFDKELWEKNVVAIVSTGLLHKYSQNPDFAVLLLATGDKPNAEANKHDK